jgi:hypothetical protein
MSFPAQLGGHGCNKVTLPTGLILVLDSMLLRYWYFFLKYILNSTIKALSSSTLILSHIREIGDTQALLLHPRVASDRRKSGMSLSTPLPHVFSLLHPFLASPSLDAAWHVQLPIVYWKRVGGGSSVAPM